jgi:hypothetical protein
VILLNLAAGWYGERLVQETLPGQEYERRSVASCVSMVSRRLVANYDAGGIVRAAGLLSVDPCLFDADAVQGQAFAFRGFDIRGDFCLHW